MSLQELLPSRVPPGALAASFEVRAAYLFRPVVSLLELLPSHVTPGLLPSRVTPGTLAGEFLISCGVLLSPRRVTPAHLAESCHS